MSPSVLFFSYLPLSKFGTELCLLPGERRGADTKTSVASVIEPTGSNYLIFWIPEEDKRISRRMIL